MGRDVLSDAVRVAARFDSIMGARQKDIVEGFIHDEICYDIPGSKKNSYIPAATSITLRRGQEILAGDWYVCYGSVKKGEPYR